MPFHAPSDHWRFGCPLGNLPRDCWHIPTISKEQHGSTMFKVQHVPHISPIETNRDSTYQLISPNYPCPTCLHFWHNGTFPSSLLKNTPRVSTPSWSTKSTLKMVPPNHGLLFPHMLQAVLLCVGAVLKSTILQKALKLELWWVKKMKIAPLTSENCTA